MANRRYGISSPLRALDVVEIHGLRSILILRIRGRQELQISKGTAVVRVISSYNRGGISMKAHLASGGLIALIAGLIAVGSAAARADDGGNGDGAENAGKVVISTPLAPAAIGPYSQAIRVGKTVYLSGQIAIDPTTNQFMTGASIQDQTQRVLENLAAVLTAAGLTLDNVVSATVYLQDLNDFANMNQVYATFFKNSPPARSTIQVAGIPRNAKVEISAIAVAP
jgi:2-iminobutanoate/2-iminopropanoate deaminase